MKSDLSCYYKSNRKMLQSAEVIEAGVMISFTSFETKKVNPSSSSKRD